MPIAAAGFEQKHVRGAIFRKTVGQHAAGRAGADDNVIVSVPRHPTPLTLTAADRALALISLIPAQAGIQVSLPLRRGSFWVPAFAGTSG